MENFSSYASALLEQNKPFFPCGGDNGKMPLCRWGPYQKACPTPIEVKTWIEKYPMSNIGLVTGLISGISVIDIDHADYSIAAAEEEFGECNFVVRTPRGGLHLYYAYSPNIKTRVGAHEKVDFRSDGGFVVFVGGVNPESGKAYVLEQGSIENLKHLKQAAFNVPGIFSATNQKVLEGGRNVALFDALREYANNCQIFSELQAYAEKFNREMCSPPCRLDEVLATAKQVWFYKENGTLYLKGDEYKYSCAEKEFTELVCCPYDLALWMYIKRMHIRRAGMFCLDQNEMAKLMHWKDRRRVKKSIASLIKKGFLQGHGKKGRANLYSLMDKKSTQKMYTKKGLN